MKFFYSNNSKEMFLNKILFSLLFINSAIIKFIEPQVWRRIWDNSTNNFIWRYFDENQYVNLQYPQHPLTFQPTVGVNKVDSTTEYYKSCSICRHLDKNKIIKKKMHSSNSGIQLLSSSKKSQNSSKKKDNVPIESSSNKKDNVPIASSSRNAHLVDQQTYFQELNKRRKLELDDKRNYYKTSAVPNKQNSQELLNQEKAVYDLQSLWGLSYTILKLVNEKQRQLSSNLTLLITTPASVSQQLERNTTFINNINPFHYGELKKRSL